MAQVLIIESAPRIAPLLAGTAGEHGYALVSAPTGALGLTMAVDISPDLVVLDLSLPDTDGVVVLVQLRTTSAVPVIVTSVRDDDPALLGCLEAGADDFVVGPFTAQQLDGRIRAALHRSTGGDAPRTRLLVGGLTIDPAARKATLDGTVLDLSPREFDLLVRLAERPGEVVTKRELLSDVWHQASGGSDKTVNVHVSWLRRKLGESAAEPRYVHTVRGVGVCLAPPGG